MMIGTVLGGVSLARAVSGAGEKRFAQVRCGSAVLTALDPVGAQPGESVLLTEGECASHLSPEVPVDAVILGIVGNNG